MKNLDIKNMQFVGIRTEIYIDNTEEKHDYIFLLTCEKFKYEYSYTFRNFRKVDAFISPTFKAKVPINIEFLNIVEEESSNSKIYSFSKNSTLDINLDNIIFLSSEYFEELENRQTSKRYVWIFYGDSMAGKSYIANFLVNAKDVYETDSNETLPNSIFSDVIVVGNKYVFNLNDIKSRIPKNTEIIMVNFKKEI